MADKAMFDRIYEVDVVLSIISSIYR